MNRNSGDRDSDNRDYSATYNDERKTNCNSSTSTILFLVEFKPLDVIDTIESRQQLPASSSIKTTTNLKRILIDI